MTTDPLALLSFKLLVKDLYVSPESLEYVQEIGEGEFALVEKGVLRSRDGGQRHVAVKSFKPYVVSTAEDLREVVVSAALLKRLEHQHVAGFHGIGCFNGGSVEAVRASLFFVEEFIGGYTLQKLLTEQMRNPYSKLYKAELALKWCTQLAEALEYLHGTEPVTVHSDVKCQNVFLTDDKLPDAEIRLADLKPHNHVYSKAPSSMVARPDLQQASLMQCRSYQAACSPPLDDSAHGAGAAYLARTRSAPTPDMDTASAAGARSSTKDLDSAAGSPPSDGEPSTLPTTMSSPDLHLLHQPQAPSSPPHPATAVPTPTPSPAPTPARSTMAPAGPVSPQHPPSHDTTTPEDQEPPPDPFSRALSWDTLQALKLQHHVLKLDGPSINIPSPSPAAAIPSSPSTSPTFTIPPSPFSSAPAPATSDPSSSGHSRSAYKAAQALEAAGSGHLGDEAEAPHARHLMECKQHGASQAFQALKAIHVIAEDAPTPSAPNTTAACLNPSVGGARRVRFCQKIPQGKTPSRAWGMLYTAPEVTRGLKYTEKVDVFSFGVVMFELLSRSLLTGWREPGVDADLALIRYAERVAEGHREPLPKLWPDALKELVSSCWHEDPHMRPRISDVVAALHQLAATPGVCDALDNIVVYPPEYHQPSCSCVIC